MRLGRCLLPSGAAEPTWVRWTEPDVLLPIHWAVPGDPNTIRAAGPALDPATVRWLAPVAPGKIVCVGRNYAEHARELGNEVPREPKLFMKPPSAVIGPGEPIVRPIHMAGVVHHEAELAVVIGRRCSALERAAVAPVVLGYTCANDVTARDVQRRDDAFCRAKGFDSFLPLGPWLVTRDAVADAQALTITCRVNGELRQRGTTADMVVAIDTLIAFISRVMTLEPYDVILTGTPAGVGPLEAGDEVSVHIDGLDELRNPVIDGPGLPPLHGISTPMEESA